MSTLGIFFITGNKESVLLIITFLLFFPFVLSFAMYPLSKFLKIMHIQYHSPNMLLCIF